MLFYRKCFSNTIQLKKKKTLGNVFEENNRLRTVLDFRHLNEA